VVTAIEILSPANKQPGTTSWDEYLKKRRAPERRGQPRRN
jgi:hypothetical protein